MLQKTMVNPTLAPDRWAVCVVKRDGAIEVIDGTHPDRDDAEAQARTLNAFGEARLHVCPVTIHLELMEAV